MNLQKNKLKQKIIINTIGAAFLFNAACTNKWKSNAIETQGEGLQVEPIRVVQTSHDYKLSKNSVVTEQDLAKLEYFLLNSSFPTMNKINLVQEYVTFLSQKYNVTRMEIVQNIESYFQVPLESEILDQLKNTKLYLYDLKKSIAMKSGISKPINESIAQNYYFISDTDEVKNLRNLNFYDQLKLELAMQKAQKSSLVVFNSLDEEAHKIAQNALAELAKTQQKDLVDKVKWISTLKEKEGRVESLKLAAEMAAKASTTDESEKKAMTAYLYTAIQSATKDPEQFNNDLLLKVNDPKILSSANKLSTLSGVIAKYSENKRVNLIEISKQLNQFSKDGIVKVDLSEITGDPEFKKHANEFGKKVAGYIDDGQTLVNLAKSVGVDADVCDKAQQALDIANKGVQLVAAFTSPNPLAIVGAVGSIFGGGSPFGGGGGPSRTELELKQLQAKMDIMITLQNRTLDEIAKTRQDIYELTQLTASLIDLVGKLSDQVATSSRILYDEIEMVSGVVKQVRELTQSGLRLSSSMCITMDVPNDISYVDTNLADRSLKINLDQCLRSMIAVDYHSKPQLDIFKSTDKETKGDLYFRSIQLASNNLKNRVKNDNDSFKYNSFLLNPINSIKNFIFDMNPSMFSRFDSTKAMVSYVLNEQPRSDDLLDASYVTAFASAVTKLAPYLTVFDSEVTNGVEALVTDNISKADYFSTSYEKILNLLNIAVIQRSLMDGVPVNDLSLDEMKNINTESDKDCSLNQNTNSKWCFFKLNDVARKNLLKLMLVKEMQQKFGSINSYGALYNADPNVMLAQMTSYFDNDIWKFKVEQNKVMAKVGGDFVEIPTAEEMAAPKFASSLELKLLLAARENLIELLADMRQNRIPDEGVRRLLMQATLRKAL